MTRALKGSNGAPVSVEQLPIEDLAAYEKHARSHPPSQITKIANSIKEFGFVLPVLIDKNNVIIGGHACVLAAKEAGMRLVPCLRVEHLSDPQVKALRLQLNRVAEEGNWLDDLLKDELTALQGLDFDLSLTGFDDRELQKLMVDDADLARAEETPPVPVNPVTVKGDVWILGGKHRVVCGDCTVATDVAKALNGMTPLLCCTDPPYGVNYDPSWREGVDLGVGERSKGKVLNDDRADWTDAYALFPGDVMYVWHPPGAKQVEFHNSLVAAGFDVRMQIIWVKQHFVIGRGNYHVGHEPCWYAVRKKQGAKAHWQGDRTQSTVWQIKNNNSFGNAEKEKTWGHGTQKPVECMRKPILNNSSPGQVVYDPFLGSGTCVIAAHMCGRVCVGLELSEAYADVIVQRFMDFSGEQAVLEGDGRTFAEIADARYDPEKNSKDSYDEAVKAVRKGKDAAA